MIGNTVSPSLQGVTVDGRIDLMMDDIDLEMVRLGFIANRVLPVVDFRHKKGPFTKQVPESLLQGADVKRASGAPYNTIRLDWAQDTYETNDYGIGVPIDEHEQNDFTSRFMLDTRTAAAIVSRHHVLSEWEKRAAALLFNATTFSGKTTAAATVWSDASAPILDKVETAVLALRDQCGASSREMSLTVSWAVFRQMRKNAAIREQLKYDGFHNMEAARITPQMLADVFDIKEVIVADSIKNTANRAKSAVFGDIWSRNFALVAKLVPQASDIRISGGLGITAGWNGDGVPSTGGSEVYPDTHSRALHVRYRQNLGEKLLDAKYGHLITGVNV